MRIHSQYWIPGIIFIFGFCLHLLLISKGPVTVDCLNLAIKSQATLETLHLHYLFGSGYPLMVLLGSFFIAAGQCIGFTDHILAVNFISVLFGSIAILVFYLFVQKICDTLTAVLASLILLLNPLFLDVSTYGINHAPALCFLLLGLLALLRFQTAGNMPSLLLSSVYFGFMGATRLQDFILTFPAIIFMFIMGLKTSPSQNNKPINTSHLLLFITTIFLLIILLHAPYFISNHSNYGNQAKNFWKIGLTENFLGLCLPTLTVSLSFLVKAFSIAGIFCFGAGLYYTGAFNKRLLIFTLLWLIIPLGFYGDVISKAPRFFNIILPALIIPMSIFIAHFLRHKKMQFVLVGLVLFGVITIAPLINIKQTLIRRHYYALIPDYYRWVGKSTEPNATIISSDDGLFIIYYSKRNILTKPAMIRKHMPPEEWTDFKRKLDSLLNNKKPVYVTSLTLIDYDFYFDFRRLLKKNYRFIKIGKMPMEVWYQSPYETYLHMCNLFKVEKK